MINYLIALLFLNLNLIPELKEFILPTLMGQQSQDLQLEIAQLEARLQDIRGQLDASAYPSPPFSHPDKTARTTPTDTSTYTSFTSTESTGRR